MRRLAHRHGSLFVSWFWYVGRSADLAKALGAEAVFVSVGRSGNISSALFRYVVQSVRTLGILLRRRPQTIIVMAPPLPLVMLAWVVSKVIRSRLIIDAHTQVFNDPKWAWTKRAFLWFARHSTLVIVTNKQLVKDLERVGIEAVDLHDPPLPAFSPSSDDDAPRSDRSRQNVVVPCSISSDEPIEEVLDAAKELHDVTYYLTRPHPQRLPASWVKYSPNVAFTGYLPDDGYHYLLRSADVIKCLTTRELTMQRGGYEALFLHKPLLTSDTEVLREYFTEGTVFTLPHADDIRAGVLKCLESRASLAEGMASLHRQNWRIGILRLATSKGISNIFHRLQIFTEAGFPQTT